MRLSSDLISCNPDVIAKAGECCFLDYKDSDQMKNKKHFFKRIFTIESLPQTEVARQHLCPIYPQVQQWYGKKMQSNGESIQRRIGYLGLQHWRTQLEKYC